MKNIRNIIQKNALNQIPELRYVFTVSDLYKYDMIYVYHHINEGTKVTLKKDGLYIDGSCQYSVYFNGFRLGSLFVSCFFISQYGNLDKIEGEIANINKEKYLPIKKLDVAISSAKMRLVS